MFVYIYVCKHQITYIILLIKCLQKTIKKVFKHTCFNVYRLSVLQTTKHTYFKHKRTEDKKKEKGQLSNTITETPTSLLHSININKKHTKSNIQRSDKDRQVDCR